MECALVNVVVRNYHVIIPKSVCCEVEFTKEVRGFINGKPMDRFAGSQIAALKMFILVFKVPLLAGLAVDKKTRLAMCSFVWLVFLALRLF